MNLSTLIYTCGIYSIAFALFHLKFWKLFDWRNDLKKLTLANRAIMQIANLRLIYLFLFIGALCFCFPDDMVHTPLGRFMLGGISLFWFGRTVEQFIFLRVNNVMVHGLTLIFIVGTILFALPLFF
jgi:hypothetical protein